MQYNGQHNNLIFGPFLGQKRAFAGPLEHKNVVFLVSGHEEIGGCAQTIDFGPKTALFGPKRATLGNRGHEIALKQLWW